MRRLALLLASVCACAAQDFTHRGFLETRFLAYPQTTPRDSGRAIAESLLRYEAFYKLSDGWRLAGGFDARTDTHRQVRRDGPLSWRDRDIRRPAFAVRRLSAAWHRGPITVELGKQFIRWGKADILNPTDRFAPRDFLEVTDSEFLAVTASRITWERGGDTVDLVWVPVFAPSRVPLFNQRWVVLPEDLPPVLDMRDLGAHYPDRPQYGVRWNRIGAGFEYSFSFYDGFNTLPLLEVQPEGIAAISVRRRYAQMRMYGADAAVPLPFVTLKAEAAYFTSSSPQADDYALYVVQAERQAGEWFLVGGYAGQVVTARRRQLDFAPDRGLARAFLARAGYTIDPNRSLAVESAVRENGDGVWTRFEYSQAIGQHWRATGAFTLIRGTPDDFLGQYRRNSHATLTLRYSF
jgi:hypothetical protein